MDLEKRLTDDLKEAMLAKDALRVSVLRMLRSELKNTEIATGSAFTDDLAITTIRKEVKKREDSVAAFTEAKNLERAESEKKEAEILTRYLPAQIDASLVKEYLVQKIQALENPSPKDKGILIKDALAHFGNQTDGKTISTLINELIPN